MKNNTELLNAQNDLSEFIKNRYYVYDRYTYDELYNTRNELVKECKRKKLNVTYLEPIFDNANSFYNKCYYKVNDNIIYLYSYDTLVLEFDILTNSYKLNFGIGDLLFSSTTTRHLLEFLKQQNFSFKNEGKTRKELITKNASGGLNE